MTHFMFRDVINVNDKWLAGHVAFWLDEQHDADTAKDFNPMYDIAGRHTLETDVRCKVTKQMRSAPKGTCPFRRRSCQKNLTGP